MSYEREAIRTMQGYVSGEQLAGEDVVKLNTNENPYPPSPRVAEALARFDVATLRRYPPPLADGFRAAAARVHGVDAEQVLPTNGSDELLRLAFTTFADPGACVAWPEPAYSLYPVLAAIQDCRVLTVPLDDDGQPPEDLAERANEQDARLLCLVNPNAPAGTLVGTERLDALAERFRGVLLLDEAYVDFVDPALGHDTVALLRRHDNVLLSRTLSKGYGLAGLRFGYGLGPRSLIEPMRDKTRDAYNLDGIAQALATAALEDQAYARSTWERVRRDRSHLSDALEALGFRVHPSHTNFLLARVPEGVSAGALHRGLRERRVLVRWFDRPGLRDHLRISVGTPGEHERLLDGLRALLAS